MDPPSIPGLPLARRQVLAVLLVDGVVMTPISVSSLLVRLSLPIPQISRRVSTTIIVSYVASRLRGELLTVRTCRFSLSCAISSACCTKSSKWILPARPPDPIFECLPFLLFFPLCPTPKSSSPPSVNNPLALSPSFFNPIFSCPMSSSTSPPLIMRRRCLASSEEGMVALNPLIRDGAGSCGVCPGNGSIESISRRGTDSRMASD